MRIPCACVLQMCFGCGIRFSVDHNCDSAPWPSLDACMHSFMHNTATHEFANESFGPKVDSCVRKRQKSQATLVVALFWLLETEIASTCRVVVVVVVKVVVVAIVVYQFHRCALIDDYSCIEDVVHS